MDTTGITGNELSLVYSYSADDLRGRALTGSIEVAAAIDGVAITPSIEVDEAQGRGEITVVLQRLEYPDAGGHELAVTLSLSAAAAGFVLGEPSSITTAFSFGALVVADADTVVTLSGPDPMDRTGITGNELSLVYSYSADDLRGRALTGSIEVVAAIDGVAITPSIEVDEAQGRGEITVVLQRREYPDAGEHELAVTLSLSAAAEGFVLGEPSSITTTFSFGALVVADADTVVTLSGPVHELLPEDATAIAGDVLSLVYGYSADDLRGRVLTGSIEVAAAIDGEAITPEIRVAGVRGEITVVLLREKYPYPGEHQLAVTLSLSAAAEGFVLGGASSITTAFSFLPLPPTVLEVRQAEGNEGKRGAAGSDAIELGYIFEYAAGNRLDRPRAGLSVQVDVELCADAGYGECSSLPAASMTLTLDDSGSLALRVDRTAAALSVFGEADADSIRHGRVLLSTAGAGDFAAAAAATTFSFAVAAAVVTLSGPVHELLPEDATAIAGDVLSLVYSYSADDLRGRVLTGSIEVAAAIDGEAITPEIRVAGVRGEITVVLLREKYPYPGGHELTVTLSLGAAAAGFVLGEPSSITTAFSFLPFPPTVLEVKQAEGNEGKRGAAGNDIIELGYSFEYAADNRLKRPRAGLSVQVDFELCTDAGYGECSSLPAASMTLTLDDSGSLTLRVDRTAAALSVFGEADADSIRHGRVLLRTAGDADFAAAAAATTFSFAVAAAVVTLSGPVPDPLSADATAIAGNELRLVYSYSADDLRGRVLTGSIEVAAAIDGEAITPEIRVAGVRGEITVVLLREKYPYPGGHELTVTLSLGAAAEGFVLGGTSSITTAFSFLPFPPTVLEVKQAEGNQGKRGAAGNDIIELGYSFEYAADNRLKRPRAGLSVQVDFELCTDAGYGECSSLPAASMTLTLDDSGSLALRVDRTAAALSVFGEADADSIRHGRVLLRTAGNDDFVATAAATTFSFAVAAAVVTLSGPVHELLPEDATAIAGDVLSLVYGYSADDLRGRVLTGSIEVAAAIDGEAITPEIRVAGVRGEITVVLLREKYPYPGGHELTVTLSLGAAAAGFVLGEPSSITTAFSFLPFPPTVLEVKQAEGNQGKRGAAGNDIIELGYSFEYAADNRLNRPLAGLSVQVDFELCTDAGYGECSSLPAASMTLTLDDSGSLALRVDRTAAALSVFGEADADSIRHGRVLLSTAGNDDFVATAAATTFSFAVAAAVVTLSGPVHELLPEDATAIVGDELSLVYSYSADDLRGRVLTGSIEVAAAIDGEAITPEIRVAGVRGEITVVLLREKYPYPGGHQLAVALSLGAAAEGFVLGEPSSITTAFSFLPFPPTVLEVKQAEGNQGKRGAAGNDIIELGYSFEYAADNRLKRPRAGLSVQVDFELCADAGYGECSSLPAALMTLTLDDSGSLALRVDRTAAALSVFGEADADSIRHGRVLLRTAGNDDFVATAAATTFSFAVAAAVVTLSGPVHELLPEDVTAIAGDELSLVYSYRADDLRGRALTGSIEVAAAIDGLAITPAIEVDEDEGRGRITVVLLRREYPDAGEHELAVTLSLSAADAGFVLAEPSSIRTQFSFEALVVPNTVVTLSGPVHDLLPADATAIAGDELSLVYSYSADDLRGRVLTGSIEVAVAIDGLAITSAIEVDEDEGRGRITVVLRRREYPDSGGHELAVTLSLSAADAGFVLAEPSSIRTQFSFEALVVPNTVVTLSGPVHDLLPADATAIAGDELSLVYSYSADDLRGRALTGSIEVAAAIDGLATTPDIEVDEDEGRGRITVVLRRREYPDSGGHELAVTLSLSAADAGFVLAEPSSIRTQFSFEALVVADTVVTLSGPVHDLLPADATAIAGDELSLVYSYSADDLRGRALTGSIEVAAAIDGLAITSAIEVDEDEGRGRITVVLRRREYPDSGGHELAVTLSLSAADAGFVLAEPSSIRTQFSFEALVVPNTVVTLSGPVPADATGISAEELSLVYSYSADDLRGRVLTGSIEVAAAIDGLAITSAIEVDEDEGRGRITVLLRRREYPDSGEHELAVTLSLSAADAGFVLAEPSSIRTQFSFEALVVPNTVVTLSGPVHDLLPADATAIAGDELSLVYSYRADDLRGRALTGSIEVAAAIDGLAITPAIEVDEDEGRGRITVVLRRQTYPDSGEHELAVTLSLSAADAGFILAEPSSIRTQFSFEALVVPNTVVTLSGPVHDLLPADATAIAGDELSPVYSYSADELRGRVLTGSIEVAATIDGLAITSAIEVDEDEGRGRITVVLRRRAYPDAGGHELAVILSLSAVAEGFVLGGTSLIETTFSFLPLPPTVLEVRQAEGNQGKRGAAGSDAIELGYIFEYAAGNRLNRPRAGLAVQVDVELCADAGSGCAILPGASRALILDGDGSLTLSVDRTLAALSVFGEADADSIRHGRVLLRTAGDADFAATAAATTFSFAVADTVVTLSGPVPADATGISAEELSLVYSYSADDLRGRVLTGSIEVAAAIDGLAITSAIEVDEDEGVGRITVVLLRREYPDSGEHELAVTLSLSAADAGFVLAEPSSIRTRFSFGDLVVPDTVVTLSGPIPADATAIAGDELSLVYSYSADDLRGRVLTGSIEVAATIDGLAITSAIEVDEDEGRGEITVLLRRRAYPDPGEHELAVILGLSAADAGFVLAEPSSITTAFSFLPLPPTVLEVKQAEGNQGKRGAAGSDAIELGYIFEYAAGNRLNRPRAGLEVQVDVELCADAGSGCAILPGASRALILDGDGSLTLSVDRTLAALSVFGEADADSIRHGRVLLRTAGDADFAATAAATTFSFAVTDTVVTLSGPVPVDATGISAEELSLVYSYSADDLHGRVLTGSIEVAAAIDGVAITPSIEVDEGQGRGEITVVLRRRAYPDSGEHELAVILSLSAADAGFVLAEPSSIRTRFSFGDLVVPDTVVTLSGPVPVDATGISAEELSLVYSYSADDLHGRVLTGSIEVAAAIDGVAITPSIEVDEGQGRGEITVVLRRRAYPDAGGHELAVILSLSAVAEGFVLGGTSLIETTFSFLPLPPTVLEVRQAQAQAENNQYNQGKPGAAGSDVIELGYSFDYAAGNRLKRPRAGLVVQVEFELCTDAGYGECSSLPAASMTLTLDDGGSLTLRVDRTAAGLSVFGEADADSIRHGRVLLRTADNADFAAAAAATTFSFAVADTVVTLSGPVPADATGISAEELSLAYSYSADDLRGRVLTGSIEVAAAIDGVAITPSIEVDEGQGRGEITVVLQRLEYPEPGEHELAVTLSLSAAAEGFVLAEPSSIRTRFSFGVLVVPDTVVTLSGPVDATGISAEELSLVYSYSADDLRGRVLTGSIEVAATIDGLAITSAIEVDEDEGVGRITVVLRRRAYPDSGEHELAVILSLSAADAGFVLAEPSSIRTRFSFGDLVVPDTVVTLSGPVHDLLPADATAIAGDELSLVYSYSADELRGRVLTGSIEVAAAIDGLAITSAIEVDEDEGVGRITVVLRRRAYPDAGEHELAVILSLSAAAEGFALGEPSLIETTFSFLPLPPTVLEVRQAEGNQGKRGAAGSDTIELGYIFEYAAGNRLNRPRAGLAVQVDVELCADAGSGCAILPGASQALILDGDGSLTLSVDRTLAALSVFGEADADSIRHGRVLLRTAGDADFAATAAATTFSFAVADTVVTLSGPVPVDATGISAEELSLVYSYSADDLHGRVLTSSIEVAAAIDGLAITSAIEVDEDEGGGQDHCGSAAAGISRTRRARAGGDPEPQRRGRRALSSPSRARSGRGSASGFWLFLTR